ncbi:SEC-C motif-containing protein [Propionivibrio dicarboxylicus]|uniref:SEC-C motif-containing protein n=2 Tax=Propionivibrio dicarboxylicus TaxID=83767 RepID=A0A1G8FW66_9RHOO|nr:SEC-C motif-containing protein [Propionivibrio dicarboxylicus]
MRRVLATDFGIWPMLQNLGRASDHMLVSSDYWSRLANYLLLYDQLVIPTGNLQILPVLRLMLGELVFDDLIRTKGIVLARFDQWFGYAGNGGGLVFFQIMDGPDRPKDYPNLGTAFFKPIDQAIADTLSVTNPPSTVERRSAITNLLLDNIVQLPSQSIADGLKEEAYKDVLGSPYLRDFLALRNAGRSLDELRGINPNQVTIFSPHVPPEANDSLEIRAVLRVAFENFLLSVGGHAEANEITGDDATLNVLRAKGQRLGYSPEGAQAFAQIQKISGVPDLGAAFATKRLSPEQLLDLRHSKHAQALRDWFADGAPSSTEEETVSRYVETIGQPSLVDSLPAKLLRFATTTGIGSIEPISGGVASAIDSFMLSKWFPGRSPRLFMKQAKVMLANTPVIHAPLMRGRDRNAPCSCGSGKKFKKCCGR